MFTPMPLWAVQGKGLSSCLCLPLLKYLFQDSLPQKEGQTMGVSDAVLIGGWS